MEVGSEAVEIDGWYWVPCFRCGGLIGPFETKEKSEDAPDHCGLCDSSAEWHDRFEEGI